MNFDLQREKVEQVQQILREVDIDVWLVWVRETSQMADPVLELIYGGEFVWQSALLFQRDGKPIAIVGNFDSDATKATGLFGGVISYTKSIKDALMGELTRLSPEKVAINFSKSNVAADGLSHGMYLILNEYLAGS
ncbi:MAG: aminopeptidase P family protein, partial [Candidatus Hodarchaeota archaeon]